MSQMFRFGAPFQFWTADLDASTLYIGGCVTGVTVPRGRLGGASLAAIPGHFEYPRVLGPYFRIFGITELMVV
jgi:hypothetical protein